MSALGLVVSAYGIAATHWRQLLAAAVPAVVVAQLLSFLVPAVVSGADGVIVNGRLEPSAAAQRWIDASLRIEVFGNTVHLVVQVMLLLGWAIAFGTCLSVVARAHTGERFSVRSAWRALWQAPARIVAGTTLIVGMGVVPAFVLWAASAAGDGLATAWVTGSASDAVGVGIDTLLGSLALIAIVPAQAAVLWRAYVWVRDAEAAQQAEAQQAEAVRKIEAEQGTETARQLPSEPGLGRLGVLGLALVAVLPAVCATGYVLTNRHGLPVVSIGEPQGWGIRNPAATGVLASGESVIAEETGIVICSDLLCDDGSSVGLPCIDGGPLLPVSGDGMGCSIEAPIDAAVLRPDGTVVALRRANDNDLRLYWCRLTGAQQCEWGGAATLHQAFEHTGGAHPATALALASTPGGGIVAAFMAPGTGRRAEIMLVTCPDLPCAQRQLRTVGEVPVPERFGDGPLALAVNQVSGSVAIGYHDRHSGDLWLGACATVDCADLSLKPVGQWHTAADDNPYQRLTLVATRTGPVAIPPHGGAGEATVVVCEDTACGAHHTSTVKPPPGGASLTTDQDGTTYVVAAAAWTRAGIRPALLLTAVPGQGPDTPEPILIPTREAQRVLGVIFDGDNQPRVLLSTAGELVVVALA